MSCALYNRHLFIRDLQRGRAVSGNRRLGLYCLINLVSGKSPVVIDSKCGFCVRDFFFILLLLLVAESVMRRYGNAFVKGYFAAHSDNDVTLDKIVPLSAGVSVLKY